jgi:alpha-L-arabinofuranosidase
VGVVVAPGEGSYSNNATHFAINPRTGTTNYGWTPIVLSELKTLGVLPDFLIYHFYWQYTTYGWTPYSESEDSDALLLQVAGNPCPVVWSDWASAAANLRQQISDYLGPAGTNIELCVTENNSDAGAMGRQSTSLVNALYLADSTSQLMKTEFRSYLFWDFQNDEPGAGGDFDPTIYGWRGVGDYGIVNGPTLPVSHLLRRKITSIFCAARRFRPQWHQRQLLLSAYAVHRTNGALTLLVINKDMTTNLNAQIGLTNFAPWTTATIQSYGIPQDQAAENNAGAAQQDIATTNFPTAGTNFTYSFPPLSLTLFTFEPEASTLSVSGLQPGEVQLLLQGQRGTPYVIQNSPDLTTWTAISTNTLVGSTSNITILVLPGSPQQFYRAVWQP